MTLSLSSSVHTHASSSFASTAKVSERNAVEDLQDFTDQREDIIRVCDAVAKGDLTRQITFEARGEVFNKLKCVVNTVMKNIGGFAAEISLASESLMGGCVTISSLFNRISISDALGTSEDIICVTLSSKERGTSGRPSCWHGHWSNLLKEIEAKASDEPLDLKITVNGMITRLRTFAAEDVKS
ncbi:uncharacterized protein EV420DRAFT_1018156 [Desarmillaria tabescens]|uniref:Uncharacterized protein n=1 Tax=Armillaria tabescens TaxID=1929756 RepID=A0AA39MRH7_ARMTA|nr:uncharacterized protein EV420DRAFT_1018156 [Desarmillaria tabescens]KAK0443972.1 hypothetical protein EV420DRAFT_1018156 [Desarmillaria tabescens]